ncbi:hypothetical protein EC973_000912 [Apophysomyces ossiformis]|uniref:TFIIE beta domain-containing protein n=1 Tax=Apophysomyces ossiformis TaxID=679940 RepID=A0A8H7BQZ0_9FUNG|nr:hypothetical protein EC973_000912 [Apophysomyces ossiformis]
MMIQFLRDCDHPQSIVSIQSRAKVDITKNQSLWEKLVNNDKIEYDPVNKTFAYKVRAAQDIMGFVQTETFDMINEGGMDYKDLKDSYSKLGNAVEELAAEGRILVIRNKDGNPRVLFYNDIQYNTMIDEEFKKMWADIGIPDETDLPKALENAGLKTMEVFEKKVVTDPKPKRSKVRSKRIKITNTHLAHIDLSKDYVPKK